MRPTPQMRIRLSRLVKPVNPIDHRMDRVLSQEPVHRNKMLDRSDGDADDVGILPLQAREVGFGAEPCQHADLDDLAA